MNEPEILDIVALIQNNPLTRLQSNCGSKIIQKIRERFSSDNQQLFVANFYCYLNYNSKTDFVINFDRIWKWMGYSRIDHCRTALIKNFTENIDYKIEKNESYKEDHKNRETRGHQAEYITITINCFKKLCLKSKTIKADQMHDYYVNLEKLMNELVSEQSTELKLKLELELEPKTKELRDKENENTLILNFKNKMVVYLIIVETDENETIIKFGHTKDIKTRINEHREEFGENIIIKEIFETIYNREFEKLIKQDVIISQYIFNKIYKTNQTELILLDDHFTYKVLDDRLEYLKNGMNAYVASLINRVIELEQNIK